MAVVGFSDLCVVDEYCAKCIEHIASEPDFIVIEMVLSKYNCLGIFPIGLCNKIAVFLVHTNKWISKLTAIHKIKIVTARNESLEPFFFSFFSCCCL